MLEIFVQRTLICSFGNGVLAPAPRPPDRTTTLREARKTTKPILTPTTGIVYETLFESLR